MNSAAEICEETRVFPELNSLTNHSRLVLDMHIVMPRVNNLRTASTCRERQWHSPRCCVIHIEAHAINTTKHS